MDDAVDVYHFVCTLGEVELRPGYMAATLEAIAKLQGCTPIVDSVRRVSRSSLEDGICFVEPA